MENNFTPESPVMNYAGAAAMEVFDKLITDAKQLFGKDNQKSLQLALEALKAAQSLNYPEGEAGARLQAGMCFSALRDYTEALIQYDAALIIYESLNNRQGAAIVYSKTGNVFLFQGKYPEALDKYNQALEIKSAYNDTLGIADLHTNSAIIYGFLGYHPKALGLHLQALKIFEAAGDMPRVASSFSNIGLIYEEQQNYEEALKMYEQALKIRQEVNDTKGISGLLINIGNINRERKNYEEALHNYQDALAMAQLAGDEMHTALSYINLGDIYKDLQQYEQALDFNQRSLTLMEKLKDKRAIVQILVNLGEVYFELQQFETGGKYLNDAIKLAGETGLKSQNRRAQKDITDLLEKQKRYEEAFYSLRSFIKLDKELLNAETSGKIARMQFGHQVEQKEKEAEIQRLRNVELKQALEQLQLEKSKSELLFQNQLQELKSSALQAQMNPHFVFNSLNAIEQYIWEKNPEEATGYLNRFSRLIRAVLDNSRRRFVTLEQDLSALQYYIELESLRFENKFQYSIVCGPGINQKEVELPPMIIQPFVENAILHGLQPLKTAGRLDITLNRLDNNVLHITIEDNGVGRAKASQNKIGNNKSHQSVAMDLTRERLEKMNGASLHADAIIITDLYDENHQATGTRVEINVPAEFSS